MAVLYWLYVLLFQITYKVITRVIEYCVQSNEELASHSIDLCDEALNPRSTAVWRYVLRAEAKIFEICRGAISQESFARALKTLAGLRNDANRYIIPDIDLVMLSFSLDLLKSEKAFSGGNL